MYMIYIFIAIHIVYTWPMVIYTCMFIYVYIYTHTVVYTDTLRGYNWSSTYMYIFSCICFHASVIYCAYIWVCYYMVRSFD